MQVNKKRWVKSTIEQKKEDFDRKRKGEYTGKEKAKTERQKMDRVHEIVGSREVHQRGILGRHVGIAILDTGDGVKELLENRRKKKD